MKAFSLFPLLCVSLAWAQTAPAPAADPNKVIVIFDDGSKMTQGQLQALIPALPDTLRGAAEKDPQKFLQWYGVMKKAASLFDTQKLADKPDLKLELEFTNLEKMADLYVRYSAGAVTVSPEEIQKYYDEHKDLYKKVKVSALEVAFNTAPETEAASSNVSRVPNKKTRTEDEAKAKADKLVADLRAGADFAKIEQAEDDNDDLKGKHGDEGSWSMTDNVPDLIRSNVLTLKEGEVTNPIRQNGGFYIVRADAVTYAPLSEVQDSIHEQVKQQKAKDWLNDFGQSVKVQFPKDDQLLPGPSEPKK